MSKHGRSGVASITADSNSWRIHTGTSNLARGAIHRNSKSSLVGAGRMGFDVIGLSRCCIPCDHVPVRSRARRSRSCACFTRHGGCPPGGEWAGRRHDRHLQVGAIQPPVLPRQVCASSGGGHRPIVGRTLRRATDRCKLKLQASLEGPEAPGSIRVAAVLQSRLCSPRREAGTQRWNQSLHSAPARAGRPTPGRWRHTPARKSTSSRFTSAGCSCCTQCPAPSTR